MTADLLDTAAWPVEHRFTMVDELSGMTVFAAVAETKGFRSAGERLGVSASAVSQELRKLEERLGVALVQRTTRSVRLTEAGERLYATARPALEEVRSAVTALGEMSDELRGSLRLYVAPVAHAFLAGPFLAGFLGDHPRATLDVDNLRRTRRGLAPRAISATSAATELIAAPPNANGRTSVRMGRSS